MNCIDTTLAKHPCTAWWHCHWNFQWNFHCEQISWNVTSLH